jgi:hypothetical protein
LKRFSILVVTIMIAGILLAACTKPAAPPAKPTAPQLKENIYRANIREGLEGGLLVYVFEGARGGFFLRLNEQTAIDPAVRQKLKAGNSIVFTTADPIDATDVPDITASSVRSVVEGILYKGTVIAVQGESRMTVKATSPRDETVIGILGGRTVMLQGAHPTFVVGNYVEFEVTGILQQNNPPAYEIILLMKNEKPAK